MNIDIVINNYKRTNISVKIEPMLPTFEPKLLQTQTLVKSEV